MNDAPEQPNYNPDNYNNIPPSNSDYPIHTPGYPYPSPQANGNYDNETPSSNGRSYPSPPGYISYAPPQPDFPGQTSGYYPPSDYVSSFIMEDELPPYGTPGMSNNPETLAKAPFLQRVNATMIDTIIFVPVSYLIWVVFTWISSNVNSYEMAVTGGYTYTLAYRIIRFAISLLSTLPSAIYTVWLVALGQTLGDKAVKIRIVDSDGNRPGFVKSLIRHCIPFILGQSVGLIYLFDNSVVGYFHDLIFVYVAQAGYMLTNLGNLWMLWDSKNQTLFDKLAGTFAVKTL